MNKKSLLFLLFFCLSPPDLCHAGSAEKSPSAEPAFDITESHWKKVIAEFEDSVDSLAKELEKLQTQKKELQSDIAVLESKISDLRQAEKKGSNVFEEIRLKGLLNDLKQKLEENSELERQWGSDQKSFEQKALSLQELYNGRIEAFLNDTPPNATAAILDSRLSDLAAIAQKRNRVDALLKKYQRPEEEQKIPTLTFLKHFNSRDRESLQSVLDLLLDRKKILDVKIEKWSQEEEELTNELKLQGKMQEFLEDIQRVNEDSGLPHGNFKRNDLEGMLGITKRAGLEGRLNEVRKNELQGRNMLAQIGKLIDKVHGQMNLIKKGK